MSPNLKRCLLAVALCLAAPLHAQQTEPGPEDLQALRFYLSQEDETAVAAEMRRLRQLFPGWVPPADPAALRRSDIGPAIDRIYRLIAQSAHDEARALIAETEAGHAGWTPPREMMELLRISEAQAAFDEAVQAGAAATAIGIGRGIAELISCERINNAWQLAEMYTLAEDEPGALHVYRATMRTCADSDILVATLEKADAVASLTDLAMLSDLARGTLPSASDRLQRTEDRLRAGRQALPRWSAPEADMLVPDPEKAFELTGGAGTMPGGVAVGGVAVGMPPDRSLRPIMRPARLTLTRASQPAPTPTPAPARSAAPAPQPAPAAAPAASGLLARVQRAADAGQWANCLQLAGGSTDPRVVFQRGWCAYNADRPMEAVAAFRSVRTQMPTSNERRDAGYGLMLSLLNLNMTDEAAAHAASLPLTREQRIEVEGQILDQRGVRAYEAGQYRQAIAFFDEHRRVTGVVRRDLELLRGYALLNSGQKAEARVVFQQLHDQLSTPRTQAALRAAR